VTVETTAGAPEPGTTPDPGRAAAPGSVVLERVTKRFGDVAAVDDLSLRIEPGEFISLLGPSGCGKTTTLRMIAGFEHPDTGDITVSGRSVLGVPPHRRDVNTVFQAYALFPHMSVAENVAYGLQQRRVPRSEIRQRVGDALDLVRMASYGQRRPAQLSGGQQQRIALARALVNRPAVLLLDEPLGALDRKLREEMQVELKLLQSQLGISFVFVTHDQGEALSMSDRIAIMSEGRIEQLADADTIYNEPASAYVAAFVGQQNFFDGTAADPTTVTTAFGTVRAAAPVAGVRAGADVRAAVRPEYVVVSDERPTAADNVARGELLGISHLGETHQYLVRVGPGAAAGPANAPDAGDTLISRLPTPTAPQLSVGDPVWCSWDAASVRLFPTDPSTS
jgi:spermidine/putrescine transport system ATP-binding protein